MVKVEIVQKKIPSKGDCFFYDGEIAFIEKANGDVYSVSAEGDIRVNIGDDTYRNSEVAEAVSKYKLNDVKLKSLEGSGKLSWENNNWFSVTKIKKGSDEGEQASEDVAYDYDEAIELLKKVAGEK